MDLILPHLYVGKRGLYKNFVSLTIAFANSKALREVDLCCLGGEPLFSEEAAQLRRLGIADRVHYLRGDDQCLADAYSTAVGFVYPSLYEGFGLPVLEAMSLGCPVIASNAASIPEVAGGAAELVDTKVPDLLASSIDKVVFDSGFRQKLSEMGPPRAALFSWRRTALKHIEVYRTLGAET